MKKLVILDLEKNYDIEITNCSYILVNRGLIKFENSKKINFDINSNQKNFKKNKKDLINYFLKIAKKFNEINCEIEANELEFFNLRNDKYDHIDKILIFYDLKKKNLNKSYKIEILTDKENYKNFYQSAFGKNVLITYVPIRKKIKNENSLLFF